MVGWDRRTVLSYAIYMYHPLVLSYVVSLLRSHASRHAKSLTYSIVLYSVVFPVRGSRTFGWPKLSIIGVWRLRAKA